MRNPGGNSSSVSSRLRSAGKLFIAAEVIGFLGCYMFWRKLNRDQDFRYQASITYPPLLEAYYTVGETIDPNNKIRWVRCRVFSSTQSGPHRCRGLFLMP